MDEHCKLQSGEIFQDFDCLLNFAGKKSDRFYRIQVLKNHKGFHVWTRWGRNGTGGQSKLDGPLSQANAEKNFKNKFLEKTKNSWDKRLQFVAVKGNYTLVLKTDSSQSSLVAESQKTEFKDTFLSKVQLPVDVLYAILSDLPVRDVLRYMRVCKAWKTLLSDKYFWRMYIERHFDLGITSDLSDEGPMGKWSGPAWTQFGEVNSIRNDIWECYFSEDGKDDDIYVMRPFPSMWNCRVFHPYGLDPFSGDVRSLQGFSRSLEILTYMRNEASRLGMRSGNCNFGPEEEICAVIFPWDKQELPTPLEILQGVFHFHPEICEHYTSNYEDKGQYKLYSEPEVEDHDPDDKPSLNMIFDMTAPKQDEQWRLRDSEAFYEWSQVVMYPSVTVCAGEDKFNPVAKFMLTRLAPGWVGGALTAVTYE